MREPFLRTLPDPPRSSLASDPRLDSVLSQGLRDAASAHPYLELAAHEFAVFVAERVPADATCEQLSELRWGDLYLAFACLLGVARALEVFEREHMGFDAAIRRIGFAASAIEETKQAVRTSLLVTPAKLRSYAGTGSLKNWVRVTAVRMAHNLRRGVRREILVEDQMLFDFCFESADPEIDHLKAKYRQEFKAAFHEAVATLSSREKNILRQHFVDGLNGEELGVLYNVHRATASRWVVKAREKLVEQTHEKLAANLRVSPSEVHSIVRLIESRLDVSVVRAFDERS